MKTYYTLKLQTIILTLLILFSYYIPIYAVTYRHVIPSDCAVPVTATSQKSPPAIILNWKKNDITKSYQIMRKLKDEQSWSAALVTLDSTKTSWTDVNVQLGNAYEYMIVANDSAIVDFNFGYGDTTYPTTVYGYGYVYAGDELAPVEKQGRLILLVDTTLTSTLAFEIGNLINDMISEGWEVVEKVVPRTEPFDGTAVKAIKKIVMDEYNKDKINTNTVFILGRVAVPYSGDINKNGGQVNATDAHPNHCGAWPADVYYGSTTESDWTDFSVTDTLGDYKDNHNVPGDGKFDVTQLL
ncbi:MAG: hypothetical protein ABSG15_08365, partial [FCB group bacterium]